MRDFSSLHLRNSCPSHRSRRSHHQGLFGRPFSRALIREQSQRSIKTHSGLIGLCFFISPHTPGGYASSHFARGAAQTSNLTFVTCSLTAGTQTRRQSQKKFSWSWKTLLKSFSPFFSFSQTNKSFRSLSKLQFSFFIAFFFKGRVRTFLEMAVHKFMCAPHEPSCQTS